jgi:hypothetical protein
MTTARDGARYFFPVVRHKLVSQRMGFSRPHLFQRSAASRMPTRRAEGMTRKLTRRGSTRIFKAHRLS